MRIKSFSLAGRISFWHEHLLSIIFCAIHTILALRSSRSPERLHQALHYHIQRTLVHTRPFVVEVLVEARSSLVGFKRLLKSDDLLRNSAQIVVQADTQTGVERRAQRC